MKKKKSLRKKAGTSKNNRLKKQSLCNYLKTICKNCTKNSKKLCTMFRV